MNVYISYFYQIRFFKPNIIPLSTCVWDPKYFHNGGLHTQFIDKNGVINGIRAECFVPDENCNGLCRGPENCRNEELNKGWCNFLSIYLEQLRKLDFVEIWHKFKNLAKQIKDELKILEKDIDFVLIVYETPKNPCSERRALQQWFKENGYELKEWTKNI